MNAAFDALSELYRRLDDELPLYGPACRGCGDCCRFDKVSHVLYASRLEREYLLAVSPLPPAPDAGANLLAAGLRCPYQVGGRCVARRGRVLGCRLHFCVWNDAEAAETAAERWHQQLKKLHDIHNLPWRYEPLFPLVDRED